MATQVTPWCLEPKALTVKTRKAPQWRSGNGWVLMLLNSSRGWLDKDVNHDSVILKRSSVCCSGCVNHKNERVWLGLWKGFQVCSNGLITHLELQLTQISGDKGTAAVCPYPSEHKDMILFTLIPSSMKSWLHLLLTFQNTWFLTNKPNREFQNSKSTTQNTESTTATQPGGCKMSPHNYSSVWWFHSWRFKEKTKTKTPTYRQVKQRWNCVQAPKP